MTDFHHFQSPDDSEAEEGHTSAPQKFHWQDDSGRSRVGVASSDGEESDDEDEAEGTETMNTTLTEGTGERVIDGVCITIHLLLPSLRGNHPIACSGKPNPS